MVTIFRPFPLLVLLSLLLFIDVVQSDLTGEDMTDKREVHQCYITSPMYRELRMLSEDAENGKKNCSTPGCFFMYPPVNDVSNFFPSRLTALSKSSSHGSGDFKPLQGCRSDIPFMLQRVSFSKDIKLHRMLRYLRACFVRDINKSEFNNGSRQIKQCQPEWSGPAGGPLGKRSWLEQNAYYAENNCFYPFYNQKVFYASFGQHSEGRVVCCSDGDTEKEQKFREECRRITEHIYKARDPKDGWRNGKDGQ